MRQGGSELELLLLGGGHAHVQVLRSFAMRPLQGVRVTVVSRDVHTPYSGMLPGHVAGLYGADDIHIDIGPLAHAAGARLIHDEMIDLDLSQRRAIFSERPALRYDLLSLDTGSTPALGDLEGDRDRIIPVKPISAFLPKLTKLLERVATATRTLDVGIVGAGAGGVELCLALAERLRLEGLADRARLHLFCGGDCPLEHARPGARRRFERALWRRAVEVHRSARVRRYEARRLLCEDGRAVPVDEVLWVTQAEAPAWARRSGLAVDEQGFVEVGPTLQSLSHPEVFAAGDLATLTHAPRPRSGVYAVRAGPVLVRNLRAWVRDRPLRAWQPQTRALYLVTTGAREAVVLREGVPAFAGAWVWRVKDAIDRRFMRRFAELPAMAREGPESEVAPARGGGRLDAGMRCSGCGSKLGTETLLAGLGAIGAAAGVAGFEDAAALPVDDAALLQTIDGFPLPLPDPWLSGRIAAIHALGDVHAMGAQALGAQAFAAVPFMAPAMMADDLAQLMAGVALELQRHGCALLGGHSCEGAEAMIALAVTGRAGDDAGAFRKGGGRAGDVLVLCKALGTGVVMAATTDGRLPTRDRGAAVSHMLQSNEAAVAVLRAHGVHACTDVTGFGLLGHALEMAEASGCSLELQVGAAVALPGALAALGAGEGSSLQDDNEALLDRCLLRGVARDAPALRLLADPQTCGGLLAALPEDRAEHCVSALEDAGYAAARVVGRLRAREEQTSHEIIAHGP
ncbi:MAG: selenide, water dikinase SelD [Pseudomonadales bacterium]|jgi:selenide,water dikinase|nr:selenide, water dikinase SelD [Pseudomonadales bacterium]